MTRTLRVCQFGLVILTLVLFGSVATAGPKPKIAILGIEAVVGANGQIDPADTKFAKDLTSELRSRANNNQNYELTKDNRELVDEKLMNNCGAEHPTCMAPIGAQMGADLIVFGKVENVKGGYKVSLKLVSVSKKQQVNEDKNATISSADTRNPGLGNWVREHFRKLMGETGDGAVMIRIAGASGGRILVNGETKETLKSGQATVNLPEGKYRIGVEADGFKLWETDVTVSADKPVNLSPDLSKADTGGGKEPDKGNDVTPGGGVIERGGTVSTKKSKTIWKVAAAVGLGGAAVTGVLWGVQYFKIRDFQDTNLEGVDFYVDNQKSMLKSVGDGNCSGKTEFQRGGTVDRGITDKFHAACDANKLTKILIPATAVLALAGGAALVYVLASSDGTESRPANAGRQKKKRNLIVTPVITPDGTGATLRFDW